MSDDYRKSFCSLTDRLYYTARSKRISYTLQEWSPWKDFYDIVPLEDDETGIPEVRQIAEKKGKGGIVYDLSGCRVKNGEVPKGVFIQNGKKFVVKWNTAPTIFKEEGWKTV